MSSHLDSYACCLSKCSVFSLKMFFPYSIYEYTSPSNHTDYPYIPMAPFHPEGSDHTKSFEPAQGYASREVQKYSLVLRTAKDSV